MDNPIHQCPCGLYQEQLLLAPSISLLPGMICASYWGDGSGKVCGKPLSAHPPKQVITKQQTPPATSIWSFDKHSTNAKIWYAICNDKVLKVDGKLKFEDVNLKWPSETVELYEREIYKTMTKDIMTSLYSSVYITGTSGIGKSFYLLYLMNELVQHSKNTNNVIPTILYKTRDSESFLLLPNGDVHKSTLLSPVFQDFVPNFVLIDSLDQQTVDSAFGPHILVASNTNNFKEFQKRVDEVGVKGKKYYMDLWSKDELQFIST